MKLMKLGCAVLAAAHPVPSSPKLCVGAARSGQKSDMSDGIRTRDLSTRISKREPLLHEELLKVVTITCDRRFW